MIKKSDSLKKKILKKKKHFNELKTVITPFTNIYNDLTQKEREILSAYKNTGYIYINSFLLNCEIKLPTHIFFRNNINNLDVNNNLQFLNLEEYIKRFYNLLTNHIKTIESVINKTHTTKKFVTYRGIHVDEDGNSEHICQIKKLKVNDTMTFDNFLSTSAFIERSLVFADNECCLLEFTLPKNVPFFYLTWSMNKKIQASKNKTKKSKNNNVLLEHEKLGQSEFEILLDRGCEFRLVKKSKQLFHLNHMFDMNWTNYKTKLTKQKPMQVFHFEYVQNKKKNLQSYKQFLNKIIFLDFFIKNLYFYKTNKRIKKIKSKKKSSLSSSSS